MAFSRILEVEVSSMKSRLDVRVDGLTGVENVSNCPYELQRLVEDQGLHCVFGRRDHRGVKPAVRCSSQAVLKEIEELQQVTSEMLRNHMRLTRQ
jgi:hypothetical protein